MIDKHHTTPKGVAHSAASFFCRTSFYDGLSQTCFGFLMSFAAMLKQRTKRSMSAARSRRGTIRYKSIAWRLFFFRVLMVSFFIMFLFLLSATIAQERRGIIVYQLGKTAGEIARFFARQVHIGAFTDVRYKVVQFVDERICTLRCGRSSADNHHRPP